MSTEDFTVSRVGACSRQAWPLAWPQRWAASGSAGPPHLLARRSCASHSLHGEKLPADRYRHQRLRRHRAPRSWPSSRACCTEMPGLGGTVIDTARGYGTSEEVIGKLLAELGNRDKFFLATKTPLGGDISGGTAVLDESFQPAAGRARSTCCRSTTSTASNELMPHFLEYKKAGKIRYIGMQHVGGLPVRADAGRDEQAQARLHPGGLFRSATAAPPTRSCRWRRTRASRVLINVPFGGRGRSCFPRVAGKPLPDFAQGIRCDDLGAVLPEVHHLAPER